MVGGLPKRIVDLAHMNDRGRSKSGAGRGRASAVKGEASRGERPSLARTIPTEVAARMTGLPRPKNAQETKIASAAGRCVMFGHDTFSRLFSFYCSHSRIAVGYYNENCCRLTLSRSFPAFVGLCTVVYHRSEELVVYRQGV